MGKKHYPWKKLIPKNCSLSRNIGFFENMNRNYFFNMINKKMLIFPRYVQKIYFFKVISKQRNFSQNVKIFRYRCKIWLLPKWSQSDVLYLEILIFLDMWERNNFFIDILKWVLLLEYCYFRRYGQKTIFPKSSQYNVLFL